MKSHLCACILALGLAAPAHGQGPDPGEVRRRWLRGNYEEAQTLYADLAKDPKFRDTAALGVSRVRQSQGEYDKALEGIAAALKDSPRNADLHARLADLLFSRGRWDEADKAAALALELRPDHFLARWVRAQIYRCKGDLEKADAEFRWFVRTYTARSDADQDVKDPDELLLVGLAGAENARWNRLADQFQFILSDIYGDALRAEKDFWPAEYQAGMLLLEKYNRGEAVAAFDKALTINPLAAEVHVGKGLAALQKLEFKDAEQSAERALKINANLVEALHLRADVRLATGNLAGALEDLQRARGVNPREEATLARVGACHFLRGQNDEFAKVVREVEAVDAKPGVFYFVLAERLEDRRRFDEAEAYFKKSGELWPMLPGPQAALGLLYMRLGREAEARTLLDKAFAADSFNVRVANTLKVLRHLEPYETIATPHFRVRFDPKTDRHLARYLSQYLETTYAVLAEKFRYQLREPLLVEIFNNHEMFSGRTIALPDLHTVGACTGRMVAMASPRAKGISRPFNWARVIRHELVHVFNLEQTRFQCPHWFTEGLAVVQEGFPRPQEWNQLLLEKVPTGELLTLDTIDLGFMRPRSPQEWAQAYCQAQLYVEYLQKKFGPQAVGEMLEAYKEGLDTGSALTKVCKVDKSAFEQGYREYVKEVSATLQAKPLVKARTLRQLQDAYEKDPADPETAARLAEQFLLRQRSAEARQLAEAVLAKQPDHPMASYVKARLLLSAGDTDQARKVLEAALAKDPNEPKVLLALGRLYFEAQDFAKAAEIFELGRKSEPYENKWLTELARTCARAGDKERQIQVLQELVPTDADDLDSRKQLARMLLEAGRFPETEAAARQALEIDVLDAEAQRVLGDSLAAQKKFDPAIEAYSLALEIDAKGDETRVKLAQAYLEKGDKKKAENEVIQVLARNPEHPEAKRLRDLLEK